MDSKGVTIPGTSRTMLRQILKDFNIQIPLIAVITGLSEEKLREAAKGKNVSKETRFIIMRFYVTCVLSKRRLLNDN